MYHSGVPLCGTNAKIGKKTVRGKTTKAEKKGFTVALAATILFEEKNRVLGQRVMSKLSIPNHVCISKQMDDTWGVHHWMTHVLKTKDECQLLVVDSYKPHVSEESREVVTSECNFSYHFWKLHLNCATNGQSCEQAVWAQQVGELDGMDEVRPSHYKNRQSKTADTKRCHKLCVKGMGIHQSEDDNLPWAVA